MTEKSPIAMFPGQGSQFVGMGKDLYENFATAREVFEQASDAISVHLKRLCFEGPESDLTLTENTQPCLLTASVAAFRVAQKETGFMPGVVIGHSLGEYSALVAAGSVDLSVATRWVRERGAAMQRAVPAGEGTMAAILGMDDSLVQEVCKKATAQASQKRNSASQALSVACTVEPANFNAPGQIVVAGSADAVQELISVLQSSDEFKKVKAIPLQVSAPFHCTLMAPAREKMAQVFNETQKGNLPKPLLFPYVPNRTGRLSQEAGLIFELLVEQIDHPVLWKQSVTSLLEAGFSKAVEFGPGKVLGGLVKRIAGSLDKSCQISAVNDTATLKALTL